MRKLFSELTAVMLRMEQNQQEVFNLLFDRLPMTKTDASVKPSGSENGIEKDESEEMKRKRKELHAKLPERPTRTDVIEALRISPANFYRNVYKIWLFPDNLIGKQPYYSRSEVIELAVAVVGHEPGAHSYFKLKNKKNTKRES